MKKFLNAHTDLKMVNPMDVDKFSAASYSFHSIMTQMSRQKRPAMYVPDMKAVFSPIQQSCYGGTCLVSRHQAGKDTKPINSHLLPADAERYKGINVHSYDENALYSSSVCTKKVDPTDRSNQTC